jgi:2-iminoacetate synthase
LLEELCLRSRALTQQRFGRVIRLFAPLYLSNECVNACQYCGFARTNPILRVTLSLEEARREARALREQGFRHLLLVAGENPKFVSDGYLLDCVRALHPEFPSLSLEVGPLEAGAYRPLVEAGAEGLVVYQETYDRQAYAQLHAAGPKRDFDWRLATPERAYAAGFRRLGLGALLGLADWRADALCVAAHAAYLLRHCWKAYMTISTPRLRPAVGGFLPPAPVSDRELVQLVCAYRLFLPDVGLVLSTREPAWLRDGLIGLGVTLMSAGSHTEPGGYTGAGRERLHGPGPKPLAASAEPGTLGATEQFEIADGRSPAEVSERIRQLGYEPVWKDWDAAFTA